MGKHRYAEGTWLTPWYCAECHPLWYSGTMLSSALLLITVEIIWALAR